MRLSILLLAVLASRSVGAQSSPPTWGATITGGLNIGTFSADPGGAIRDRTGAFVGIGAMRRLTDAWSIQPEIAFSTKGADIISRDASSTVSLGYLELPLLMRYDAPTSWRVRAFALAGPQAALRMWCGIDSHRGSRFRFTPTR